ncbi:hypothetical protein [Phytoactinopolyspora halotolerans]|uniref:Uncharacterized protein n=1 Tax=Phytoactinopolyspora halotolerans TaxID=1981512 RepID=A0A6L9SE81_9ACTN|nr:hypothetical protein [Phytoactinopolyspora halotolerans]NEE02848.1 hypothetical protein [Phytoactinopolyspora halotolerans]
MNANIGTWRNRRLVGLVAAAVLTLVVAAGAAWGLGALPLASDEAGARDPVPEDDPRPPSNPQDPTPEDDPRPPAGTEPEVDEPEDDDGDEDDGSPDHDPEQLPQPDDELAALSGLWTGSSFTTMQRGDNDVRIGYTTRADFWFTIDEEGAVSGHAHAVYQPTFDAAGLNARINVAKDFTKGVVDILPGGSLGLAKAAIDAAKAGGNTSISGIVGVNGKYEDDQPIRSGEIAGHVDEATGQIHIDWVDEDQGAGIPITVSLAYINENVHVTDETLEVWSPWNEPGQISAGSRGWLMSSDSEVKSDRDEESEDAVEGSVTQHWSAQRVGAMETE